MVLIISKELKTLGVDIDGTLADIVDEWLNLYRKEFNVEVSKEDAVIYDFSKIFPFVTSEKMKTYFTNVWIDWKKIPPIISNEEIKELNSLHNKLRIDVVTSSLGTLGNIKEWLKENNINYSSIVFVKHSSEKYKYCDILIDDKLANIKTMLKHGKEGILLKQVWSSTKNGELCPENVKVANSWKEAIDIVKSLI